MGIESIPTLQSGKSGCGSFDRMLVCTLSVLLESILLLVPGHERVLTPTLDDSQLCRQARSLLLVAGQPLWELYSPFHTTGMRAFHQSTRGVCVGKPITHHANIGQPNLLPKHGFERSIESFGVAIALRVVCCGTVLLNPQQAANIFHQMREYICAMVREHGLWHSEDRDQLLNEYPHNTRSLLVRHWYIPQLATSLRNFETQLHTCSLALSLAIS